MKPFYPGIDRQNALRELDSFIKELERDASWLEWAPGLLALLHSIKAEASVETPDSQRLKDLQSEVHDYFAKYKFLKGLPTVLELVDAICKHDNAA